MINNENQSVDAVRPRDEGRRRRGGGRTMTANKKI